MANKLIQWNASYATGCKKIDEQHQKLVDIVNELYDAFLAGTANEKLGEILKSLNDYTVYHFETEEQFMQKYNYPQTDAHKETHEKLIDNITEFYAKHSSGDISVTYDVMNFLRQWLVEHIQKEDMQFADFLKENNISGL